MQTVKAESHVDGIRGHEYARGRRNAQHRAPRSKRTRSLEENASRQRITRPSVLTISMAQGLVVAVGGAGNMTSLNMTGTGRLEA